MSTKIHGFQENELKPSWQYEVNQSEEGLFTASQVLFCRYIDYANTPIANRLAKGARLIDLNPRIPVQYDFLTLQSYSVEHQRGGITKIKAKFIGASDDSNFGGGEDRTKSTSFRGVLNQGKIIEHPKYLKDVTDVGQRNAIASLWDGSGKAEEDKVNNVWVIRSKADVWEILGIFSTLTEEDKKKTRWIEFIQAGRKFYDKPQIEWSITYTNRNGMQQEDIDDYGLKVSGTYPDNKPPGNPPEPSWVDENNGWWQFTSISEDKSENASSYSATYTLRDDVVLIGDDKDFIKTVYTRDEE